MGQFGFRVGVPTLDGGVIQLLGWGTPPIGVGVVGILIKKRGAEWGMTENPAAMIIDNNRQEY